VVDRVHEDHEAIASVRDVFFGEELHLHLVPRLLPGNAYMEAFASKGMAGAMRDIHSQAGAWEREEKASSLTEAQRSRR